MRSVDIAQAWEKADGIIAVGTSDCKMDSADEWPEISKRCARCVNRMDGLGTVCIKVQIEAARECKRKLDTCYLLKDCARDHTLNNANLIVDRIELLYLNSICLTIELMS
jgi:hypothetical protein